MNKTNHYEPENKSGLAAMSSDSERSNGAEYRVLITPIDVLGMRDAEWSSR